MPSRGRPITGPSRRDFFRYVAAGATAAGAGAVATGCAGGAVRKAPLPSGPPRYGGRLRVGIVGGSSKDTLDAHAPVTHPDQARVFQLYDTLLRFNDNYEIEPSLAESVESDPQAVTWTIRLREGVEFHNGKPLDAEDVIFTLRRISDPANPQSGAVGLTALDRDSLRALDSRTVRFTMLRPDVTLPDQFAQYANGIVPVGYDPDRPVGTGPFAFDSFEPGQQSVFTKHRNYWREGEPYLDELVISDFPDDTARVNALLGGQVDAIDQVPLGLLRVLDADPNLRLLESQTGAWLPFTMRVDRPPFDDVRVRQAFRLVVDRQQMIDQVLGGHGTVGNDLYSPLDSMYNSSLPQRTRDVAKARRLLKEAGKENLSVELVTSPVAAGTVEAAQVFAQQAAEAGIRVSIRRLDPGEFFGDQYLSWDFAQDFWFTRNFLSQAGNGSLPESPYNETHWAHPEFTDLVQRARATTDPAARRELIWRAQQIEWESGGHIIWGFPNQLDAHSVRVAGLGVDRSGIPLNSYGFRRAWLAR
ncbi:peptide/nickel transport system substrate-binding protein [Saccharopolyspora erythraea NRRL 2338]|uniref:ABC transporter substrate-binding protein n=3 Tax=Saccharopolyspora erythraea TaxID=1836 RepID=A0ABN1EBL1_SACER|nr:ABC transporter substrate-binding protein [Saccharopolyspora erythraea]PFG94120.1 peptide/nickel transport system substrate-binding protein [Saccharopolyspora erythraea NRRL 2338]QRK90909.1 ABC transporter substrate-binding protein [Saccharopolyspora erythraea]CAM00325.1 probable peptide ABC transporter,substrate-binding protein [Saccharopolyspora erythraea NRRL 2338]